MEFILRFGTMVFQALYCLFKLLPTSKKVTFISRQSNVPSLDIDMLEAEIKKQHPDHKTVVLCRKIEGGMASKIGYCFHMLTQMYHLATSKVIILDSYCILASCLNHKKSLLIIQMWHSVGTMKQFGYSILDMPEGSSGKIAHAMKMHKNYDHILCAGEGYRSHLAAGFGCSEDIIEIYPLPRVEALKDEALMGAKRKDILAAYPELSGKKNILYTPTFRKNADEHDEFLRALQALRQAFEPYREEYNLIIKAHPLSGIESDCPEFTSFDMISVSDIMISDYSCIIYEGAILGIPLYFYTYDYENYTATRAIYMDFPNEIPSPMFSDPAELLQAVASGTYDMDLHEKFLTKYVEYHRDNITSDIVEFIWSKLK